MIHTLPEKAKTLSLWKLDAPCAAMANKALKSAEAEAVAVTTNGDTVHVC